MYIIFEIQKNADGTIGTLVSTYADKNQAESAFHSTLASAAVSSLPVHSVLMIEEDGFVCKSDCYRHEVE